MRSQSDNIETIIKDKTDKLIEELFQSLYSINQIRLETYMKGRDFVFHCVHLLHYKCHKINLNQDGS